MAGHTIALYFTEAGHDVTAYSRRRFEFCNSLVGDVTDFCLLESVVRGGGFDAVINAVGMLNSAAELDKAKAVLVNSYLPHHLSQLTSTLDTKLIHMSTDCVFSGQRGGYLESSLRDGLSFYDRSKALGELENRRDLTFRNSIVGPDMNANGIGLFNWFMQQRAQVRGFARAMWTGVTTLTLAKAMEQAIGEEIAGVYHLVNNVPISKLELISLFNQYFRNNEIVICRSDAPVVDKSLKNTRTDFTFVVPDYEVMVAEMKQWIVNHRSIYPHYVI
jgi:dTDP-4-dehydrorhamnose reductase